MRASLRRTAAALLLLLVSAFALALELIVLDVGQGLSVVIRSPSGQNVLYDAGPGSANVASQLRELGVEALDLVIASHAHADHIGGMEEVIRAFEPRLYMDNAIPHSTLIYERTLRAVEAVGSALLEPVRRTIRLGDVRLEILPPTGKPELGQNNNSIGVRVSYGDFHALLPGDAEGPQWQWWQEQHPDLLAPVDLHVASHHGSRAGDTGDAIGLLTPHTVAISVGTDNPYGHPHDAAMALYGTAYIVRTDTDGRVRVRVEPEGGVLVEAEKITGETLAAAPRQSAADRTVNTGSSCIDLNRAKAPELESIRHIGPERAGSIVALRAKAPFATVADLVRIDGIGAARIAEIEEQGVACVAEVSDP